MSRWRFIDGTNPREVAQREEILRRIDSWWRAFEAKTTELSALFSQKTHWDLPAWMERHLQVIHPQLMWEYGQAVRGKGHRLVITPESEHHLRPLVQTILERAPTLDGWEFYAHRLPESLRDACAAVKGRVGVDISDYMVKVSRGGHNQIDLIYTSPTLNEFDVDSASDAAFVATETLLGEKCLDTWIGGIDAEPLPPAPKRKLWAGRSAVQPPHYLALDRLSDTVSALIESLREQLPERPHYEWVEEAGWTGWELKPKEADDYRGRHDLLVGISANPAQWAAAHSSRLFSSERFSRCGETFCYLKLDGSDGLDETGFADRSEIEDAIDAVLKPDELGCHISGGTGLRYSYIDLALTDVDRALPLIRSRLQAGKVPKRSWIQFWDSDLAAEWVGIYAESPPPPMPE